MEVHDLVGSKVWVKEQGLAEHVGYIAVVSKAVDREDIETSINASTFIILLESGDLLETAGFNLSKIEHAGYVRESVGSLPIDKTYIGSSPLRSPLTLWLLPVLRFTERTSPS